MYFIYYGMVQTVDTNSAYMAKFCFSLGISLKRVEVIGDIEEEIIDTTRRMSENYDFVVTSGGIGPTSAYPVESGRVQSNLSAGTTTSPTNP